LFTLAGSIRDIQVQAALLHTYESQTGILYPEFTKWLKKQEATCIATLKKSIEEHELKIPEPVPDKNQYKKLLTMTDEQFLPVIRSLENELISNALKLSYGRTNCESFHTLRKITKRLRYILKPTQAGFSDNKVSVIPVETLREIETVTGSWHDNLVRVEMLNRFLQGKKYKNKVTQFKYTKLLNSCEIAHEISFKNGLQQVRNAFDEIQAVAVSAVIQ